MQINIPQNIIVLLEKLEEEQNPKKRFDIYDEVLSYVTENVEVHSAEFRLQILERIKHALTPDELSLQFNDCFTSTIGEVEKKKLYQPITNLETLVGAACQHLWERFGEDEKSCNKASYAEETINVRKQELGDGWDDKFNEYVCHALDTVKSLKDDEQAKYVYCLIPFCYRDYKYKILPFCNSENLHRLINYNDDKKFAGYVSSLKICDTEHIDRMITVILGSWGNTEDFVCKIMDAKAFTEQNISTLIKTIISSGTTYRTKRELVPKIIRHKAFTPKHMDEVMSAISTFENYLTPQCIESILESGKCTEKHIDQLIKITRDFEDEDCRIDGIEHIANLGKCTKKHIDQLIEMIMDFEDEDYRIDGIKHISGSEACTAQHIDQLIKMIMDFEDKYKGDAIGHIAYSKQCTKKHIDQLVEIMRDFEDKYKANAIEGIASSKQCTKEHIDELMEVVLRTQNLELKYSIIKSIAYSSACTDKHIDTLIPVILQFCDDDLKEYFINSVICLKTCDKRHVDKLIKVALTIHNTKSKKYSMWLIINSNLPTEGQIIGIIDAVLNFKWSTNEIEYYKFKKDVMTSIVDKYCGNPKIIDRLISIVTDTKDQEQQKELKAIVEMGCTFEQIKFLDESLAVVKPQNFQEQLQSARNQQMYPLELFK